MARRLSSPIFVGRRTELDRVAAGLASAAEGQPSAYLVAGEAGVGKTRLIEETAATARDEGYRVLVGGCIELADGTLPFAPIVEALRGLPGELEPADLEALIGRSHAELVRLMPTLGEAPAGAGERDGWSQGRLFELFLGFLSRLAAQRPILLVVEDLHWADRSTLDLLTFLVRTRRKGAVVLIGTYRSDELHRRHPLLPVLAELERSGRVDRLELSRLDRPELGAMLAGILGVPPDRDLVERIQARSQGNPFYAEELLAAEMAGARLPETLREVLLARVATLSEPAQELLRLASAGRTRISGSVLAGVAGTQETELLPALREAVGRHILAPLEGPGSERYAFRHALIQEAVYGELLPAERTRLHAAYARILSERGGSSDLAMAAELAHHWSAAHDLPRALEAAAAAGLAAERRYAFAEAQAQFEHAIGLWDKVPEASASSPLDRVELMERAARAAANAGRPARAVAHARSALAIVDSAGDVARAGLLHERLGRYLLDAAEGDAAIAACRDAVRIIPADPPSAARARVLAGLSHCLFVADRHPEAAALADEAITMAQVIGAPEIEAHALVLRANGVARLRDSEGSIADCLRAREIARAAGAVELVARAYWKLAWVTGWAAGRWEDAITTCMKGFAYAQRNGLIRASGIGSGTTLLALAAHGLYLLGRWEEAEQTLERARLEGAEVETRPFYFHYVRAELDIGRGRLDDAESWLDELGRLVEHEGSPGTAAWLARGRAELAIWQGEPLRARAAVKAGLSVLDATDDHADIDQVRAACALAVRAEADVAAWARARRADQEAADAPVVAAGHVARMRAVDAAGGPEQSVAARRANAYLALCEAEVTRLNGRSDARRWATVAAGWNGLHLPYPRSYALYRQAEALLQAGSRTEVGALLREAHGIAAALGAEPLGREIGRLAARARVELDAGGGRDASPAASAHSSSGVYSLTPREREVLALIAAGRTNRQIGAELFISENTAGVHVSNILGKLGAAGRTEAAMLAHQLGLLQKESG